MKDNKHESVEKCLNYHLKKFFDLHNNDVEPHNLYHKIMTEVERVLITETMNYSDNVQAKAAKILGINRSTLSKKLKVMKK